MSHLHARISPRLWEFGEKGIDASIVCSCQIFSRTVETSRTFCQHGSHRKNIPSRSPADAPMRSRMHGNWCVFSSMFALGISPFLPFLPFLPRHRNLSRIPPSSHHSSLITRPDLADDIVNSLAGLNAIGGLISKDSRSTTRHTFLLLILSDPAVCLFAVSEGFAKSPSHLIHWTASRARSRSLPLTYLAYFAVKAPTSYSLTITDTSSLSSNSLATSGVHLQTTYNL